MMMKKKMINDNDDDDIDDEQGNGDNNNGDGDYDYKNNDDFALIKKNTHISNLLGGDCFWKILFVGKYQKSCSS